MPLPLLTRTATGRPLRAVAGWVAMAKTAYIRPATVQDAPRSVQSHGVRTGFESPNVGVRRRPDFTRTVSSSA
jgi:hypothetical protein